MQKKTVVMFFWNKGDSQLTVYDITIDDALEKAKKQGYAPSCWYKPSTWGNYYSSFVAGPGLPRTVEFY